ncbi:MAG: ATP-binding protein, partial [Zoogloea sp.]|nr:ATP-binding protein [Zoogloea sp.]
PNRALYCTVDGAELRVFPIRYEDSPIEVWTVDPSLFPAAPGYEGLFSLQRFAPAAPASPPPAVTVTAPAATPAFRSNIPTRGKHPFVGREALLQAIEAALGDPATDKLLVLHGPQGVGKSELAREFARAAQRRYPGGSFQLRMGGGLGALDLARIGRNHLQLHFPPELPPEDQAERTLLALAAAPSLLIFDNVVDADEMRPWLPRAGMPCHVLVTSWNETLALDWAELPVPPLSDRAARQLVDEVAGNGVPAATRRALLTQSDGLPVHLLPAARALAVGARRGRPGAPLALGADAEASFRVSYDTLDAGARLLLHAAAFMNPQQIVADELRLAVADTSAGADFACHLDACQDFHLLEGADELRMHQLFAAFVLAQPRDAALQAAVDGLRAAQWQRCVALARAVAANPAADGQVYRLLAYRLAPADWLAAGQPAPGGEGEWLGQALAEIGRFDAARPWFERAVAEKERGDVHDRVDHVSLGTSLHQVGYCLSSLGEFAAARPWYERAVAETERGDVHGRVDHERLGSSLHQVGDCLSSLGEFAAARPWYERAVAEKERGDVHGRVDHANLGTSLHQVGYCFSSVGEFAGARPWFERAVAEAEQGDVHGRVNHESLGSSLHRVGDCLSRVGEFAGARPWYERAVAEAEQGDVHGRVDHESLGSSLHLVGYCLSSVGEFAAARPWFERAVTEAEQGDVHGRVDHESLGSSLHQVGYCLFCVGEFAAARPWYERAVAEMERGDVFGRVDAEDLAIARRSLVGCIAAIEAAPDAD